MAKKTMMEMREDERLFTNLGNNIEYAIYTLDDGFCSSEIYESAEGEELLNELTYTLLKASGLAKKLLKIVSKED